ncbi:MAG: ATP-binding protein [Streptomycetales bacterium]
MEHRGEVAVAGAGCGSWTRAFPGEPLAVGHARAWLAALLDGGPLTDEAQLVLSELATNAVRHTASREYGFTVTVEVGPRGLCLRVTDAGAPEPPVPTDAGQDEESGRGLRIVEALATRWGCEADRDSGCTVWAELTDQPGRSKPRTRRSSTGW